MKGFLYRVLIVLQDQQNLADTVNYINMFTLLTSSLEAGRKKQVRRLIPIINGITVTVIMTGFAILF